MGAKLRWSAEEDSLIRKYYGKLTSAEMQKFLPTRTEIAIARRLSYLGVTKDIEKQKQSRRIGTKRLTYNASFFKQLSAVSAYWAGFIAADGNISIYGKTIGLMINLKGKDGHILEQFIRDCEYTGKVHYTEVYSKQTEKHYDIARLWIYGIHDWAEDLANIYNITPNKSLTLQPPNITDPDLIKAFIVGYIDGDGGIRYANNSKSISLQILGTKEILSWILQQFSVYGLRSIPTITQAGKSKVSVMYIYGIPTLPILAELFTVDVPRLNRKWNIAREYLERKAA